MSMESYSKIVNVMTSRTGVPVLGIGHFGNTVKVRHFFENLSTLRHIRNIGKSHGLLDQGTCT